MQINKPIIKILTPLYTIVYVQGKKIDERQEIIYHMWIRLGMYMAQANLNLSHIHRVFITPDDCNNDVDRDLVLSGGFPDNFSDLSDGLKKIILEDNKCNDQNIDNATVQNGEITNSN